MKKIKKLFKMLCLCMIISSLTILPVFAAEENVNESNIEMDSKLRFVSSEEMDQLIANFEAGIAPCNWFSDYVAFNVSNEGNYCKVVFLNVGFPFDRCDVDGTITLYDAANRVVANHTVNESKLVYGIARVIKIYPVGGSYTSGTYSLRVSDGDIGTVYTGSF